MKLVLPIADCRLPIERQNAVVSSDPNVNRKSQIANSRCFTLVEMLVTMGLLSLIVLALMAVFNSTQNAFRASLTQTDILESGRNVMDLMAEDLAQMTPSYGANPGILGGNPLRYITNYPVNFYANVNYYPYYFVYYQPLVQALPGTAAQRTNIQENFFMLSRQNVNGSPCWVGTGYVVDPMSNPTNSLYRFTMTTNVMNGSPVAVFIKFIQAVFYPNSNPFTNTAYWSHLMDGVVDLTARPYDPNGLEMTNTYEYNYNGSTKTFIIPNTYFAPVIRKPLTAASQVFGFYMFSNTVPASVEVELGVLEDSTLQRAESLPTNTQTAYLSSHVGQVHLFRQRVWIRNVDPTAYQ